MDEVKRLNNEDKIREEVTPEHAKLLNDWASTEWNRCMALRGAFENHAVTYLLTANGGGAATVIAFAGSASYATPLVYWSLSLFIAGLICCGLGIVIALKRMSWISMELSREQDLFNKNKIGYQQFHHNHSERFERKTGGTFVGYLSFGCFILGVLLSAIAFNAFAADKLLKSEKKATEELFKQNEATNLSTPADKITFVTSWFAEAEHGGFYQAIAEGIYQKHGLDVSIRMGGPQVNAYQLVLAGQADFAMGYDIQTLKAAEQGLPLVTVAAVFQRDPAVLIAHPDVKALDELKTRTLLIGQTSETTFWPWLKKKYGFRDEQKRPYAFSVQPFLVDNQIAQQGLATSEPYAIEKAGIKPRVFLLADVGYPPYAETIVATDKTLKQKPDVVRRFVQATAEGWKSYLKNPAPGNALIVKDNPQIEPALLDYGVKKMREYQLVTGGDAQTQGLLTMTAARWQQTRDFLVQSGLLRADVDAKKAYTLDFLPTTKVLP